MSRLSYRADIDGLRAIAVLLVILFHAGLGFPGGFVGVDVFFVISGYLITGVILNEQRSNTFSLSQFWIRRIRRLAPAALAMVVVTLAVGTILLFPTDLETLATTVVRQQCLVSNHFFARHTGYFDGPAELMPLLHTWSLAVEEQFYLAFPILLVIVQGWRKSFACGLLTTLGLTSFALSIATIPVHPNAAYFLLPYRGWEMLLGAALCYLPETSFRSNALSDLLAGGGLLTIALCSMLFSARTPFPGFFALIPCLGAASVLLSLRFGEGHVIKALRNKLLVAIGLISYSLYLWHWPILAYLRYEFNGDLPWSIRAAAVAVTFVAAYVSWLYIEVPCRRGSLLRGSLRPIFGLTIGTATMVSLGLLMVHHQGLPARYSSEKQHMIATMRTSPPRIDLSIKHVRNRNFPVIGDHNGQITCLLWGDSHAMALNPSMDIVCIEAGIRCTQITRAGTLPLVGYLSKRRDAEKHHEFTNAVFEHAVGNPYDLVVLSGYWYHGATDPQFEACVKRTVDGLTAVGSKVIIVRDVPDQKDHFHKLVGSGIRHNPLLETCGVNLVDHRNFQSLADKVFDRVVSDQVTVVDPAPFLTDSEARCRILINGESMYADSNHLSLLGCQKLTPMFRGQLGKFIQVSHGHSTESR